MFRSIRNQIVIFAFLLSLAVVAGYFVFWRYYSKNDLFLMEQMKQQKLELFQNTIALKSRSLQVFTDDYTYWDEMVSFIENKDFQWGEQNIPSSLSSYEVDYVWIYNASCEHFVTYNSDSVASIAALPYDKTTIENIVAADSSSHFYFYGGGNLVEVYWSRVRSHISPEESLKTGGYFFAGKLISQKYIDELSAFTGTNVSYHVLPHIQNQVETKDVGYSFVNSITLNSWDDIPIVVVYSIFNNEVAENFHLKGKRHAVFGALITALFLLFFVLVFYIKIYRPIGYILESISLHDSSRLKKILGQKNELGRFAVFIDGFFKQEKKLLNEIEERNQVEKLLVKLSQAIEQSPATIIITGVKGMIEYVNPRFTQVTGYKLDEVIGRNPRFLKSGNKMQSEYYEMWKTISSGRTWRGEFCNRKKNGEIYYESAIVSPIFDENGSITNYLAVNEDVTERRRQDAVRNVIFEIAQAGSAAKNLGELIEKIRFYLNDLVDVTNFYIAFYDEKTDTFSVPFFHDKNDVLTSFSAGKTLTAYVLRRQESFLGTEKDIEILKQQGLVESLGKPAKIWLGVPLIVEGKALGVFTLQSYDDEKAFSLKDKEMIEFVTHEISHTVRRIKAEEEIILALERAEQSDRLKSAFLANISHEIRTPLNSILGFTKLLGEPDVDAIKLHRYAEIILNNGNQLLSIINGVLDFSMIETGQIKLLKKRFAIEKVVQKVYSDFLPAATQKQLELIISPDLFVNETFIDADYSRLKQAVANVVDNAIKFTKKGTVELSMNRGENFVQIVVRDTGIGIPYDFKKSVFDQFQQADRSSVRRYGGNGLGLAIAKYMIELMGGQIWFESELNAGSVFYIEVPYKHSASDTFFTGAKSKK
jgi:PAS domain S-box-containing protein